MSISTSRYLDMLNGDISSRERVGGKAASLSQLAASGCRVPATVALTIDAYDEHVRSIGIPPFASMVSDGDLASLQEAILTSPVPEPVRSAIEAALATLFDKAPAFGSLAVRSSATAEDSAEYSFAGLHDTVLGVAADVGAVEAAVKACWASLWSERSVDYRRRGAERLESAAMGVVIQELIHSDVSFVVFTVDPVHGCARHTIISASFGLGETIVAGLVRPDHIVLGPTGAVHSYDIGSKEMMVIPSSNGTGGVRQVPVPQLLARQQCMTLEQAEEVCEMARSIERHYGMPLDVEGGIANRQTYVFQARPITTCGRG